MEALDQAHVVATRRNDDVITTSMGLCPRRRGDRRSAGPGVVAGLLRPGRARSARVLVGAVPIRVFWRPGRGHWLLSRRTISTDELAYYVCCGLRRWAWPASPGPAGRSRSACSRPRTRRAWTITKSVTGGPGMPTSLCPWPHTPGSLLPEPCRQRGTAARGGMMIGYTVPEIRRLFAALIVRSY
jgi:hypothetical protein